jgi:3-dehydroquinate dehydratase-2
MKLLVLHGPNLNLLGERPGDVPGLTLASLEAAVRDEAARGGFSEVRCVQSNHEGALVDALQEARGWATAVLLNPGALTHASYVLHDALAVTWAPVVEVHLSCLDDARAPWRKQTVLADVVEARIHGKGVAGYVEAVQLLGRESAAAVLFREEEREAAASAVMGASTAIQNTTDAQPGGAPGLPVEARGAGRGPGVVGAHVGAAVAPPVESDKAVRRPGTQDGGVTAQAAAAQRAASVGGQVVAAVAPSAGATGAESAPGAQTAPDAPNATVSAAAPQIGAAVAPSADAQGAASATISAAASHATDAKVVAPTAVPGVEGGLSTGATTGPSSARASTGSLSSWNVSNIPPAAGAAVGPGEASAPLPVTASATPPRKTLGRRRPEPSTASPLPAGGAAWPSGVPTRAEVASRIARHLSGSEPASALAAFAREGWMRLDGGAEVPPSERPLLEDVLRRLMFLDRKAGALDASDLVELLARIQ